MSDAAQRLSDAELASLTKRLSARPLPRDASAMAAPSRRVVDISTRRPLGLSVPADDPRDDIVVDDTPIDTTAAEAEILRYRKSTQTNRQAWLSDIDILILRAIRQERRFSHQVLGMLIGEVIGEMGNELRQELGRTPETPEAQASLRCELAELKAALAKSRAEVRELKLVRNLCAPPAVANGANRAHVAFLGVTANRARSGLKGRKASPASRRRGSS